MNIKDNQRRKTTIKEVAKRARVSIATVSRVINNQKIVKKDKRQKILEVIAELNYVPNPAARSLGKKQPYKVAVVVPNISNPALTEAIKGIFEILYANKIDMVLFNSNENPEMEKKIFLSLSDKLIEGAIFIAQCGSLLDFSQLTKRIPVAVIERAEKTNTIDKFEIDNYNAMDQIVDHLYNLGHRKIVHISGLHYSYNSQSRKAAFRFALEKKKLQITDNRFISTNFTIAGGVKGFNQLLKKSDDFTAVTCSSDLIALGAISSAIKSGYTIGENMSIVGYDGFSKTDYTYPAVTSINYPGYKMGMLAAKAIIDKLDRGSKVPSKKITLKVELVDRETTGINKRKQK